MTPKKRAIVDASFIRSCPENGSAVRALVDQGYHLVLTDYLVYELCSSGDPKRWSDAANKLAPFSDELECWHHSAKMLRTECETKHPVEEIRDDQITNLLRKQLKKDPSYLPADILQLVGYHGQQRERDTPSAAFRSFTALRPMATSLENAISNKGLKECTPGCAAFVQNRQNVDKIIDMVADLPKSNIVDDNWMSRHIFQSHLALFCDYLRSGAPDIPSLPEGAKKRWINRFHDLDYLTMLSGADAIASQEISGEQRWYREWIYGKSKTHLFYSQTSKSIEQVI